MQSPRKDATQQAEALYSKATKAELEGDLDRAFKLYLEAAQGFLHNSRVADDAATRTKFTAEAQKALIRAEKIKGKKRDVAPVVKDHFSEQEQLYVLQKTSSVRGIVYPLWRDTPPDSLDLSQPTLSRDQQERLAIWRSLESPVMGPRPLLAHEISQHVISDCSFCASVVVCVAHNERFGTTLGLSALYPQDSAGRPLKSDDGRHSVRMLVNGSHRRIGIDNKLPTHPDGWMLCMVTRSHETWPALLEKAYMKLMGGYEFPGSLSTTDLYTLTGWIPEHIDMSSATFGRERSWSRIHDAFEKGQCMLTLGTAARIRQDLHAPYSLLPAHCYAVIDIKEDDAERLVVIRDPWQHFSSHDGSSVESGSQFPCPALHPHPEEVQVGELADVIEDTGVFTVPWDDVCTMFDGIYLSWDPTMFANQLTFHGIWTKDASISDQAPRHFQLKIAVDAGSHMKDEELWVLLTRHITDTSRTGEAIALSVQDEESVLDVVAMSLKGEYTNNTQVLVRTSARSSTFTVVASYDGDYADIGFTVTAYSSCSISWEKNTSQLLYKETISGTIARKNAGGNPTFPTFMNNPQYHVRILPSTGPSKSIGRDKKCRLELSIQGDRHIPFNATAVWSQGQRVTEFANNDVVVSSGAYSYGYASASKDVAPGDYTLVVSAFDIKNTGPYTLKIGCSSRFEIKPIPQEGAGMCSKVVKGTWTSENAAGAPKFGRYKHNPAYELKITSQSQVIMRLQLADANPMISLNITVFQLKDSGRLGSLIATSGPYSDSPAGVVVGPRTLPGGVYVIIPSTFDPEVLAAYKLIVYSSTTSITVAPFVLQ